MRRNPDHGMVPAIAPQVAQGGAAFRSETCDALRLSRQRNKRMRHVIPLAVLALAGCDPQVAADAVARRAAATVVLPVAQRDLPTPQARQVTGCIIQNASEAEVQNLARDVAVVAGTLTQANIRAIAVRPATQACFAANGVAWGG